MAEDQETEDVECVVAVVGKGERMDESVVVDYCGHDGEGWDGDDEAGERVTENVCAKG